MGAWTGAWRALISCADAQRSTVETEAHCVLFGASIWMVELPLLTGRVVHASLRDLFLCFF